MTDLIKPGYLEVFCGPMNSGKSREILYNVELMMNYDKNLDVLFVKPKLDTRSADISSRFGSFSCKCFAVDEKKPYSVLDYSDDEKVVVIDEAQFFAKGIENVVDVLLNHDKQVMVAGLDLDFRGEPFGRMPYLMAMADNVIKLIADCEVPNCSNPATRTQRLVDGKPAHYDAPQILIGDDDEGYMSVCRKHHKVPGKMYSSE